jgi:serine/threonine protein kinase
VTDESSGAVDTIPGVTGLVRLGVGGSATVFRGRQTLFDRPVAVKVMHAPVIDDDSLRRFQREMAVTGRVTGHPHIATVFSSGVTVVRRPYLVMEYCAGGSLATRLKADGPMPWQDALSDGVRLTGALATAHGQGLLHRDVKPGNVLLDAFGQPKLCDFGIAILMGGETIHTTAFTFEYGAPELIAGEGAVDVRADIYSMALTIRAMLLGASPWASVVHKTPQPLPDDVPTAGSAVLDAAISDDPGDRPSTAIEFGDALTAALTGAGVTTPRLLIPVLAATESAEEPPADRFCGDCGAPRLSGAAFCGRCGYRFRR